MMWNPQKALAAIGRIEVTERERGDNPNGAENLRHYVRAHGDIGVPDEDAFRSVLGLYTFMGPRDIARAVRSAM